MVRFWEQLSDRLIDRLVQTLRQHAYATDLRWLRRQFRARGREGAPPGPDELRCAERMRALRASILGAIGLVEACRGCAAGHPLPNGRYAGGFCCGGATDALFTSLEIAALAAGGTRTWHLHAPRRARAGCVFRGPGGCSLPPDHRPTRCVTYLCTELSRDLAARGRLERVETLCSALERELRRFEALHAAREAATPLDC